MNVLLDALNKRDYDRAKNLIQQGKRLNNIEKYAFGRELYNYLADYEIMKFLTQNGYNTFFFPYPECRDERGRMWGILARAYVLGKYEIMELLFGAGFNMFIGSNEQYWIEGRKEPYPLWKGLFLNKFDKKVIDMMLSHGYPATNFNDQDYDIRIRNYICSKPQIKLKSFSLGPWYQEIPVPQAPRFHFFTLGSTKDYLNKQYEQDMREYEEQSMARQKYINKITREEWKALEEQGRISSMANQALAKMVKCY